MNFRRLKYFVKIVDIGSLTQAADSLHIAQPALSQQVATLESELDQQLLIRTKRGVTPTDAGKVLYAHARAILRQCEQAQLAVNSISHTLSCPVAIGLTSGTSASSMVLPLLQSVRAELPNVQVYLHENDSNQLHARLLGRQLDMALLHERAPLAGISCQTLLKEEIYLVGAGNCPGKTVNLNKVTEMNLFLPPDDSAVRQRIDEAFALRRLSARIVGEIESLSTLTAAIASGSGVTLLPESAARALCAAANGWMARIANPSLSLPMALSFAASGSLSPQAQAVKDMLLSLISCPTLDNGELLLAS